MKYLYLVLIVTLVTFSTNAQHFSWVKSFKAGTTGFSSDVQDMDVDLQGNMYLTGTFSGSIDFDPGPAAQVRTSTGTKSNADDIFLVKLNAAGEFQWVQTMGGASFDVSKAVYASIDGNVYITGYFYETIDLNPGPGTTIVTGTGNPQTFVVKFGSDGTFSWGAGFVGSSSAMEGGGHDIIGDEAGNIYVTGAFGGTLDFDPGPGVANLTGSDDAYILKLSAAGQYRWVQKRGTTGVWDVGQALAYSKGNLYCAVELGIPGEIVKLDTLGNIKWAKRTQKVGTNTEGQPVFNQMIADPSGNVITTGHFSGIVDFDPGTGVVSETATAGTSIFDAFIWKLDSDGNHKWVKKIGSGKTEYGKSLVMDPKGHLFVTGTYGGDILTTMDGQTLNLPCIGYLNSFVAEFDAAGKFLEAWRYSPNSPNAGGTNMVALALSKYGDLFIAGAYWGTVDFDPGAASNNYTSTFNTDADLCITKLAVGNIVSGKVFVDDNADQIYQATELLVPHVLVRATNNTDTSYGLTDRFGRYLLGTGQGTYTLTVPEPKVYSTAPAPLTVNFSGSIGAVDSNKNIPVALVPGIYDLYVTMTPLNRPRTNRDYWVDLVYENRGTHTASGNITVNYATGLSFVGTTPGITHTGNTLQYSFTSLVPGESRLLRLFFKVSFLPAGFPLSDTAIISPVINDTIPQDNYYIMYDTVRASFDPNDKLVYPRGNISPAYVASDTGYLDYTIRFQNTGNDTAFNVMLIDTLSTNLDISTLQMIGASHLYTTTIEGRTLRFMFNDILLPDSTTNEPLSHGYVRFRIRPLSSLSVGAEVRNKAAIYFDYNEPVITNQTLTTVAVPVLPVTLSAFTVKPDACKGAIIEWATASETGSAYFNVERTDSNTEWQSIAVVKAAGYSISPLQYRYVDKKPVNGTVQYRLKQADVDGAVMYSAIRSIKCEDTRQVYVYPNPANDAVYVYSATAFRYQLKDVQGKLINEGQHPAGNHRVSLENLSAAIYMLQVFTDQGSKSYQVVKQ